MFVALVVMSRLRAEDGAAAGRLAPDVSRLRRAGRPRRAWPTRRPPSNQKRGWAFLQAGDLKNAEREFAAALKAAPASIRPRSASATSSSRARMQKAALAHFDRALERQAADASGARRARRGALALEPRSRRARRLRGGRRRRSRADRDRAPRRGAEVPRGRAAARRARAAAARRPARRGDQRVHSARSRARRTARFCIASWRASNARRATPTAALAHFRTAARSRSDRRGLSDRDRRDPRGARRFRRGRAGVHRRAGARAERRASRRSSTPFAHGPSSRGCPPSTGRSTRRRRSRAAIWRRSSASAWRRCCSRIAASTRCRSPTSETTGRRPGFWPSRAPA